MREQGLYAQHPRHRTITTKSDPARKWLPICFSVTSVLISLPPNGWRRRRTCGQRRGGGSLAVVLDLFSRMVGGWSRAAIQDATLVTQALHMAVARRRPQAGLLHHTDRGSPSTSESSQALLRQEGMRASMSRPADWYDKAAAESFFHRFKGECIDSQSFQTQAQARSVTFDSIETFYNRTRRHSTLHYVSPFAYEQLMC